MELKNILLLLTAGEPNAARLAMAALIARRHGGLVSATCLVREPEPTVADCYAVGPEAVAEVAARTDGAVAARAARPEAEYREIVVDAGLSAGWSLSVHDQPAELVRRARAADLVILRRPQSDDAAGRLLAETFIMDSGAPCLLVPESQPTRGLDRIVLAWNDTREARHALDGGMALLRQAAAIDVVNIERGPAPLGKDDGSAALLRRLDQHGVTADLTQIACEGTVADTLVRHCAGFGADLLIMGGYGHARAAEALLGGTTRTLLTTSPIPVLMAH